MPMTAVRMVVDTPVRTPYRFGMFSVLDFADDDRAGGGFAWEAAGCEYLVDTAQDACIVTGAPASHTKTDGYDCAVAIAQPFSVMAFDNGSMGRGPRVAEPTRSQDRLVLGEQLAVEAFVQPKIAAAAVDVTAAGGDIAAQIGEVEMAVVRDGSEGLILVRRSLIARLEGYFTQTGSMLRTKLGTPVAALGSWTGDAEMILGVSFASARRSGISFGHGWDKAVNDHADFAERDYAIGWECPVKATAV